MSKPNSWKLCPSVVLESWLWDLDLDYCSYDSSKAEVIHYLSVGAEASLHNEIIISKAWDNMSEENFTRRLDTAISQVECELKNLRSFYE